MTEDGLKEIFETLDNQERWKMPDEETIKQICPGKNAAAQVISPPPDNLKKEGEA